MSSTTGQRPERRLLYVISRYTYRSTFIVRELDELAARGWAITVVSLRRPRFMPGASAADLQYDVAYERSLAGRVLRAALAALTSGRREIFEYVRLIVAAFGRSPRLLARNLSVIPKACFYAAEARRLDCRHIHAHWATVSTSAAMLMSRLSGTSFSFTGHAWDIFCDTRLLAEKGDAARFVLTCTDYNRRHLVGTARMDPAKVHVLYHGLRIPTLAPGPRQGRAISADSPLELLTVGRWSEKKGFLDLIEALARVRDAGVPFRLHLIAGDGSPAYERRVRDAIAAHTLADRVRISEWLPSEGVEAVMRASDLFVLPCVTPANNAMDGIPNVLIEALSVGLPVVATRLSGIPELVRHGETGLLVNERDPRGLAAALIWCAGNLDEMNRLAAEGRRLVEHSFDIRRTISGLERHFDAVVTAGSMQHEAVASPSGPHGPALRWHARRDADRLRVQ